MAIFDSVVDMIGRTPLLRFPTAHTSCDVYLKLEKFNPGQSVKDRAALNIVRGAEERGELKPGGTIVESSSGNTGIALAMIGAALGYRVIVVVDNHTQQEKIETIKAYGASVERVAEDKPPDYQAAAERVARVKELCSAIPGAFFANQGDNLDNRAAHYKTTAEEIVEELGEIDCFFATVGTGGSVSGTGRRLKELCPDVKVFGVEPAGSVLFGHPYAPFHQSGSGSAREVWQNIDFELIDETFRITDRQAFTTCRHVARRRGLLIGGSAGSVLYKTLEYVGTKPAHKKIVTLIPDGGERYLTTAFSDAWMRQHDLFDPQVSVSLDAWMGIDGSAAYV